MAATANTNAAGTPRKSSPGHGGVRAGAGRKKATPPGQTDPYQVLARAKAKRETYRAQMAELEYKEKLGELIREDEAVEIWSQQIQVARARFMALPTRLSSELAQCSTIREAERILREAIKEVLTEVADG